jgi:hypothetical protein
VRLQGIGQQRRVPTQLVDCWSAEVAGWRKNDSAANLNTMEDGARNVLDVEKLRADDTKWDLLEEVPLAQILGSDFVVRGVGRGKRRYGLSTGGTVGYSSMTSPRQARAI